MQDKTKSILEELSQVRIKKDPENFVESRASHIINSAIHLVNFIREHFDQQTAYNLEKKFNNAIKNLDDSKFTRGIDRLRERKVVKKSFIVKDGEYKEDD